MNSLVTLYFYTRDKCTFVHLGLDLFSSNHHCPPPSFQPCLQRVQPEWTEVQLLIFSISSAYAPFQHSMSVPCALPHNSSDLLLYRARPNPGLTVPGRTLVLHSPVRFSSVSIQSLFDLSIPKWVKSSRAWPASPQPLSFLRCPYCFRILTAACWLELSLSTITCTSQNCTFPGLSRLSSLLFLLWLLSTSLSVSSVSPGHLYSVFRMARVGQSMVSSS